MMTLTAGWRIVHRKAGNAWRCEALNVSQTQLAATLDVSQPSTVEREKCESGLKRLTQKRMLSPLSACFRLVLVND